MGATGRVATEQTIHPGDMARMPDGTSAQVIEIVGDQVRGTHLVNGKEFRFTTTRLCWMLLRDGIIPKR